MLLAVIENGNQLPQQMRVTQGVHGLPVRVAREPRVAHGATGECEQDDPGGVHRFAATPPVTGDQRQQLRRRRMQPTQGADGLVSSKWRHIRGDNPLRNLGAALA